MKRKSYIIAFFFLIVDLISKQVIVKLLEEGKPFGIINNFFYLTYTKNMGAAWSILENQRILLLIITVIVLFLINRVINKEELSKLECFSFGMIIGGIVGNLFDRIFFGYVIDFLDFKLFGYNYPIFNLADSFIVIGIILMVIISIRKEYYERSNNGRRKHKN